MKLTRAEWAAAAVTLACVALVAGFTLGSGNSKADYTVRTEQTAAKSAISVSGEVAERSGVQDLLPQRGLDINTADAETLCLLPGIGEVLAQRIVDYRRENGRFADPEDVMNVRGIGEGIFAKISDYITTGDKS